MTKLEEVLELVRQLYPTEDFGRETPKAAILIVPLFSVKSREHLFCANIVLLDERTGMTMRLLESFRYESPEGAFEMLEKALSKRLKDLRGEDS